MKIKIISEEAGKQRYLREAEEEYIKRLSSVLPISFDEKSLSGDLKAFKKLTEKSNCFIAALDLKGEEYTSDAFSKLISKKIHGGIKEMIFLIGGSDGLHPEALKSADIKISLSKLTFTHHFSRLILLEQLYRAHTILQGSTYHK